MGDSREAPARPRPERDQEPLELHRQELQGGAPGFQGLAPCLVLLVRPVVTCSNSLSKRWKDKGVANNPALMFTSDNSSSDSGCQNV
jgi:hypothetical protein